MKQFMLAKNVIASNFRRLNFPYKLTFVATYKCQSRCVYCSIWKKKPVGELRLDEIQSFFKKSNKFSWIDLTGGEVTLRDDFVDITNTIITNCKNLYFLHTPTNGLAPALIERKMRQVMELKPNKFLVTVSLDGPRELNDKLRGVGGDFDKVVDTVKRLKQINDKNFKVVIGFTLSASNKGTFQQMIGEVKEEIPEMRPDDFHMNIIHTSGHYYENIDANTLNTHLREDVKKYRKSRKNKLTPIGFLENQYLRLSDKYLQTGKTPITCQALAGSVFIDSFGYIYPCTIYSKKLANIKDIGYDLETYWNTRTVKDLRKDIEKGNCPHCWTPCEAYQSILGKLHKISI
jgi:MoaA/NifB/PqqE/SkfB family radical SAM enzyme